MHEGVTQKLIGRTFYFLLVHETFGGSALSVLFGEPVSLLNDPFYLVWFWLLRVERKCWKWFL